MAIVGRTDDDARLVEIHEGIEFFCFLLADDIEFETDILRAAFQVTEPFFFEFAEADAQAAGLVETGTLAGLLGQDFVVQLDRVIVDLRDRMVADEVGT